MNSLKYLLGVTISIPLLPLLYAQGRKVRNTIPKLPEATGMEGVANAKSPQKETIRLITLGESTIAGVGVATHEMGFSGTLAKTLARELEVNVAWKVYAKSGYTALDVRQKFLPQITEEKADLIVIGLGANDAFSLHHPKKWRKDVEHLILDLQKRFPAARIVFCNMPPIKEFPAFTPVMQFTIGNLVEMLGNELKDLVQSYESVSYDDRVITLDYWGELLKIEDPQKAFFSDGVHPSPLAYQTWGEEIAGLIVRGNLLSKA